MLASERGPYVAVVLGLLLSLPAMSVGFVHDDLTHRLVLEDAVVGLERGPTELYDFTTDNDGELARMIDAGHLPWFTSPDLSFRFFRPLSSLTMALDHALFGRAALPAHLHSLLWFAAMCLFAAGIFRRTLRPTSATFASALYTLAGAHVESTSWIAARHSVVGAAFGLLAIVLHLRAREDGDRRAGLGSLVALSLGMLSSETALGAVVFIVLHEGLARRGARGERALAAAPAFSLGVLHLAFYVGRGYGVHGSKTYIAPFRDPLAFAETALRRIPALAGELYGALPSTLFGLSPTLAAILTGTGIALPALVLLLLVRARPSLRPLERRRLIWLGASSILCLLPMVGGFLGGRLLPIALVGSAALVSTAMVQTKLHRTTGYDSPRWPARLRARWLPGLAVAALALLHFGLSPLMRAAIPFGLRSVGEAERRIGETADLAACPDGADAYVISGADAATALYGPASILFYAPAQAARLGGMRVLAMPPEDQTLSFLDERTFELAVVGDERRTTAFEEVYRGEPLPPGTVVQAGELTATVLGSRGHLATRVRFEAREGLSATCFVRWDGARLVASPPGPPGAVEPVVHALGPMGL